MTWVKSSKGVDWLTCQDDVGDVLDDAEGDHDGFVHHWDDRLDQESETPSAPS